MFHCLAFWSSLLTNPWPSDGFNLCPYSYVSVSTMHYQYSICMFMELSIDCLTVLCLMHGTVWMSSVNQKMLWSKYTSMMYTLTNCPCAQKIHISIFLLSHRTCIWNQCKSSTIFMAKLWKKYGIQIGTNKDSFLSQKEIQYR